jgi:uncharacterized protein with PIN domain
VTMLGERRIIVTKDLELILTYVHACDLTTDDHSDQLRRFAYASDGSRDILRSEMGKRIQARRSRAAALL